MFALRSAPAAPSASDKRLLEQQIALMCRFSPAALRGGIGAAAIMGWVGSTPETLPTVLAWIATLLVVSIGRSWLQSFYVRNAATLNPTTWLNIIQTGLVINGFIWSFPASYLVPPDPAAQTVLAILTIGVAATAIASLSPLKHAYAALLLPFMAPIAISYLWRDDNFRMVSLGIVLFIFAMLRIARRQHDAMTDLLRLQIDLQEQIEQRETTEAELRVAKTEAEAANRAKSQFLANMSHELRTPLNGVLGMSELLIRDTQGKQLKHAHTIRNAGLRLLRIISDILDLARLEAGTLPIARSNFSPRTLTAEVSELLREQAAKKGLGIDARFAVSVPELASSDPGRIQQILSNLIDNAIKFSDAGNVTVNVDSRVDREDDAADRWWLRWEVRDSGVGIAAEAQAKLFKPFSQLDASATRRFGGAGLGLAISRQLVEALGGSIGVHSVAGSGSTFWFEIPVSAVAQSTEPKTPAASSTGERRTGCVLIVEDNPINRELAAEILQATGCSVATAGDGKEALERIAEQRFDLVLMDWHMPLMDGLAATRQLRTLEAANGRQRLPVIALTASVLPGDREACEAAGMDGFVAKPFTYDELIAVLDRWLPAPGAAA